MQHDRCPSDRKGAWQPIVSEVLEHAERQPPSFGPPRIVRNWARSRPRKFYVSSFYLQLWDEMHDFLEQKGDVSFFRTDIIKITFVNCLSYTDKVLVALCPWDAENLLTFAVHPCYPVAMVFGRQLSQ